MTLMDKPLIEVEGKSSLMSYLTQRHYLYVKDEVEAMTEEQALGIWNQIDEFYSPVCMRAGAKGYAGMQWTSLLRKMTLIERKAKGPLY